VFDRLRELSERHQEEPIGVVRVDVIRIERQRSRGQLLGAVEISAVQPLDVGQQRV
jgi:hypothetical protein